MPGEAFIDQHAADQAKRSAWVDAEAFIAETERLTEAAETEAALRKQLAGLERAAQAAESDAEARTTTWEGFVRVGLTYRQVDHWTARGWLLADTQHPGSGKLRRWPVTELEVARLMRRMTNVGVEPWAAHVAARAMVAKPEAGAVRLGHGVWIDVR